MNWGRISSELHLSLAIIWSLLLIPTLVWWKESIVWVAGMMVYQIVIGHIGNYLAARAKEKMDG